MRYNDATGHWELWDAQRGQWIDLWTCDTARALEAVRRYMEDAPSLNRKEEER